MGFWGSTRRKGASILGLLALAAANPTFSQEQEKERSHQERFADPRTLREREEREANLRLRKNPNDGKALEDRGVARMRMGRVAEAVADLERATALQPKSADVRADLAYGLMQLGKWREALAAAQSALVLNPNHVAANAYAGHLLVQAGTDVPKAIEYLERAAASTLDDVDVRIDLLTAYRLTHDPGRAAIELRVLRLLLPYNDARLLYEEGVLRADSGDLDAAIEFFRRALAANASLGPARQDLGVALAQAGRWQEALEVLGPFTQAQPQSFTAAYFYALALHNGLRPEAEAAARRAAGLQPKSSDAQTLLGVILASQGKNDEAALHLRSALELDPASFDATLALGRVLANGGKLEEGLTLLYQAVKLAPESASAHLALAEALHRAGKLKESEQETQAAERLKEKQPEDGKPTPP